MTDQDRLALADEQVVAKAIMQKFIKRWFLGSYKGPVYLDCVNGEMAWLEEARAAIQALRALAQSGGEPVAWRWRTRPKDNWTFSLARLSLNDIGRTSATFEEHPLYATPIAGEPGAWREAVETAIDIFEHAHSGFIPGSGPDLVFDERRDEWIAEARAALASAPQPAVVGQHCACGQMVPMEEYEKLMWQLADAKEELAKASPAPQPDVREAYDRCMDMLGDVPGATLEERLTTYIGCYMALQIKATPPQPAAGEREEMVQLRAEVARLRIDNARLRDEKAVAALSLMPARETGR